MTQLTRTNNKNGKRNKMKNNTLNNGNNTNNNKNNTTNYNKINNNSNNDKNNNKKNNNNNNNNNNNKKTNQSKNQLKNELITELTPYQGNKKTYGYFKCEKCDNQWESGNSWANCGQMCLICDQMIYPHKQTPLETSENHSDQKIEHPSAFCEKCKKLGFRCTEIMKGNHRSSSRRYKNNNNNNKNNKRNKNIKAK